MRIEPVQEQQALQELQLQLQEPRLSAQQLVSSTNIMLLSVVVPTMPKFRPHNSKGIDI